MVEELFPLGINLVRACWRERISYRNYLKELTCQAEDSGAEVTCLMLPLALKIGSGATDGVLD